MGRPNLNASRSESLDPGQALLRLESACPCITAGLRAPPTVARHHADGRRRRTGTRGSPGDASGEARIVSVVCAPPNGGALSLIVTIIF